MALCRGLDPFEPSRPKLLIVEGDDDQQVMYQLAVGHLRLSDIEIRQTEGTGNLRDYLDMLLKLSSYRVLTTIAVIQDTDETPDRAFAAILGVLASRYSELPQAPGSFAGNQPRVGALILSSGEGRWTLEDVCLASVAVNAECLPCVEEYLECLRGCDVKLHPNEAKHRAHAYLASLKNPTRNLGQAASDGVWDFDHEVWAAVKQFLLEM